MSRPEFKSAARQQQSLLAGVEKRVLLWLAERMPAWVNSDHLTLLGFLAMILAGASYYAAANYSRYALFAGIVCLAVNWFGDSLDGTLARFRNRQRPRYGFYVDHIVDMFGTLALIGGLGVSDYMSGNVCMALLIAYFMLSGETYLATHTMGVFKLSYGLWGPTELRILLAIGNIALFFKPLVAIRGQLYRLCDVGGFIAIIGISAIVVASAIRNTAKLYDEERLP